MGAEKLVFVEMPWAQPRHEKLPEPAGMALAHRHAAAVPGIEIADQADPLRVRRPDRERDPFDAVMQHRVRPKLLIAREMVALDEQVDVEISEHRRKTVDVVEVVPMPAAPHPQTVAERRVAVRHAGDKEPGGVDALALGDDLAGRRVDDCHPFRIGQHRPHIDPG